MTTYAGYFLAGVALVLAVVAERGWHRALLLTRHWHDRYITLAAAVAADGDPESSAYFALVHLNAGIAVPDPDGIDIEGWRQ